MKVKSFVLCEQIRQENTGKFMLIGVFGTNTVVNNISAETRWINPVFLSIFSTLEVDRETDAGLYIVKDEVDNGKSLVPEMTLEIKKDGASYFPLPLNVGLSLKGPSNVRLNIYKKDTMELVAELGSFSVIEPQQK